MPVTGPSNSHKNDQPLWKRHFPTNARDEEIRSRRSFVRGAAIAGGAVACGNATLHEFTEPAVLAPISQSTEQNRKLPTLVLQKKLHELAIGEALLFRYPHRKSPCLLMKLTEDRVVAFVQKCTHLACPVIPEFESGELHCPCHHGKFDLATGQPTAGPPRKDLSTVQIEVSDDGTLTAVGMA